MTIFVYHIVKVGIIIFFNDIQIIGVLILDSENKESIISKSNSKKLRINDHGHLRSFLAFPFLKMIVSFSCIQ